MWLGVKDVLNEFGADCRMISRAFLVSKSWKKGLDLLCHVAIFMILSMEVVALSTESGTSTARLLLEVPSAGPSWKYLPSNRMVSIRSVDWCQGGMLPLQRYRSIRPKLCVIEERPNAFSCHENKAFLETIVKNEDSFHLSQTSLSMLRGWSSLTPTQCDQLAQKIRIEQKASQPIPMEALEILYCDDHICVTNKPSGVLSVPGPRRNPSLANLVYETLQPEGVDLDQMVVHRLDMATSGILVFALSLKALSQLHTDFKQRRVQKTYQALVFHENSPILSSMSTGLEGEVDVDLERDPNNAPFMRIAQPKESNAQESVQEGIGFGKIGTKHKFYTQAPKESLTTWTLLSREILDGKAVSRLELRPWTGRTHQLRVHCAQALGAPIVGDDIYGTEKNHSPLCLHARQLCMYHPISGAPMIFEADPPF